MGEQLDRGPNFVLAEWRVEVGEIKRGHPEHVKVEGEVALIGGAKQLHEVGEGRCSHSLIIEKKQPIMLKLEDPFLDKASRGLDPKECRTGFTIAQLGEPRMLARDRPVKRGEAEVGTFQATPKPSL